MFEVWQNRKECISGFPSLHKGGKTLPLNISTVTVRIRKLVPAQHTRGRRVRKEQDVDFPVIHCSSWLKGIPEVRPEFWLGNIFGEKACKLLDDSLG